VHAGDPAYNGVAYARPGVYVAYYPPKNHLLDSVKHLKSKLLRAIFDNPHSAARQVNEWLARDKPYVPCSAEV
jgi:hypothetical protein